MRLLLQQEAADAQFRLYREHTRLWQVIRDSGPAWRQVLMGRPNGFQRSELLAVMDAYGLSNKQRRRLLRDVVWVESGYLAAVKKND